MTSVTVIGAGNGGLTTALMLAKAGLDVTVLEAHSYPGGCAGTFRRKHYRFDAGATLAGGFNQGEVMDQIAKIVGIKEWKARFDDPAMVVHLSSGATIPRYGDTRRWEVRKEHFGDESLSFWKWQERTADALWDFASRSPPFPPQGIYEIKGLFNDTLHWLAQNLTRSIHPSLIQDLIFPVSRRLKNQGVNLREFVDAQLLISAQTISRYANAMFSASALDLPRRGVVHLEGGIGTIARQLEDSFISHGGKILYKQKVISLRQSHDSISIVTNKHLELNSDFVIANLTPWNLRDLLPHSQLPLQLKKLPEQPQGGWGAFMVYLGIDEKYIPAHTPLHHQILDSGPMTEGNSIFISISPLWDLSRAPSGKRAITISTHTNLSKWWSTYQSDPEKYLQMKENYISNIITLARRIFPDIHRAELLESGTPLTFNHFTNRKFGWVGGFRQEHLFKTFGPRLSNRLWLVGDSIFPGQSTAAVSLGGLRVARSILQQMD